MKPNSWVCANMPDLVLAGTISMVDLGMVEDMASAMGGVSAVGGDVVSQTLVAL